MPFEIRKQEPGPPPRNTGPGTARPASRFFRTGAAGQIPLVVTRNGSKTCKAYTTSNSVGPSSGFKDGSSPPISTREVRSKATPSGSCPSAGGGGGGGGRGGGGGGQGVLGGAVGGRGREGGRGVLGGRGGGVGRGGVVGQGGVVGRGGGGGGGGGVEGRGGGGGGRGGGRGGRGGRGGGGSQVSGKLLHSEDQITERLKPVSSFTIPPTEEDLKQLQYGRDKNGHIKKSPNAFVVWCHIHYQYARRQNCPGANMIEISIVLAREWSKLSEEQKRPYYEVAHKLKCMQEQQIHDSVLRQQKKKDIECLSSRQGAGQDPGISFSQAVPPALSNVTGPMYPYPPTMPYGLPTYPISSDLYSSVQNNHLGFSTATQNTSSSTEEVRNYHSSSLPQRDETTLESHVARYGHQAAAFGHQQSGV